MQTFKPKRARRHPREPLVTARTERVKIEENSKENGERQIDERKVTGEGRRRRLQATDHTAAARRDMRRAKLKSEMGKNAERRKQEERDPGPSKEKERLDGEGRIPAGRGERGE